VQPAHGIKLRDPEVVDAISDRNIITEGQIRSIAELEIESANRHDPAVGTPVLARVRDQS
jgi:hypothetical protein